MSNLKGTIESLATTFANSIIHALRSASIDELSAFTGTRVRSAAPEAKAPRAAAPAPAPAKAAPAKAAPAKAAPSKAAPPPAKRAPAPSGGGGGARKTKSGRLGRRSEGDIANMIEKIVAVVSRSSGGLRAEQIRSALNVEAKELPRPLADAVNAGRLSKTGQKRATTYFAGGKRGKKR